jgi:5-formyltetrahydrofolate cyclo-ligase
MNKQGARELAVGILKEISKDQNRKTVAENEILENFIKTDDFKQAKTIAVYISLPHEFNTSNLIDYALSLDKRVCVPKIFKENEMRFYEINKKTKYELNKFRTLEPINSNEIFSDDIDLIVTPGVLFHKSGYRLGYGGGFYDRYLSKYKGKTIALTFKETLSNELWDIDKFDIKVNKIITDKKNKKLSFN